jgi:rhodanese-related sulfurtransferase
LAVALALAAAGCGGAPADNSVSGAVRAGVSTMRNASVGHLQAGEARGFLAAHSEALVLDVREAAEWSEDAGHIEGARRIPLGELAARIGEIEWWKDKPVIVVDRSGARSMQACRMLAAAGFQQTMNLEGGMVAWGQTGE